MSRKNKIVKNFEKKYYVKIKDKFFLSFLLNDPKLTSLDLDTFFSKNPTLFNVPLMVMDVLPSNTAVNRIIIRPSHLMGFNNHDRGKTIDNLISAFEKNSAIREIIITRPNHYYEPIPRDFSTLFEFIRKIQIAKPECKIEIDDFIFKDFTENDIQQWMQVWQAPATINTLHLTDLVSLPEINHKNLLLQWLETQKIKNLFLNSQREEFNEENKNYSYSLLQRTNIEELTIYKTFFDKNIEERNSFNDLLSAHNSLQKITIHTNALNLLSPQECTEFFNSIIANNHITKVSVLTPLLGYMFTPISKFITDPLYIETFLQFLEYKSNLIELDLTNWIFGGYNQLHTDRFFNAIMNLNKLETLNLNLNVYFGSRWNSIEREYFNVSKTYKSDALLKAIPGLLLHPSLQKLNLQFRCLNEIENFYELVKQTPLNTIDISGNQLSKSKLQHAIKNHSMLTNLICHEFAKADFNKTLTSNQLKHLQQAQSGLLSLSLYSSRPDFPTALVNLIAEYSVQPEIIEESKKEINKPPLKTNANRFSFFACFKCETVEPEIQQNSLHQLGVAN